MTEKKVVVRLNYSLDRRPSETAEPEMITEWHVGRIVAALVILIVLAGGAVWFMWKQGMPGGPSEGSAAAKKDSAPAQTIVRTTIPGKQETSDGEVRAAVEALNQALMAAAREVPPSPLPARAVAGPSDEENLTDKDPRVVQAVLSKLVYHRQPVGLIENSVYAQRDKAIGVFYYTRLKSMKGERIYHEWWHQGKLMFRKSVTVRRDPSLFYTSKLVNTRMLGNWQVFLKDSEGQVMDSKRFEVKAPQ